MSNRENMIAHFHQVQAMGWVKSRRRNNTGIGKTFEDYVGVIENNLDEPDLFGFEIKSHREESSSYVTLCTKAPTFPRRANAYLLNKFGSPSEENPIVKRLHTSMFADHKNTHMNTYAFKLNNNRATQEVRIEVYDLHTGELLDDTCGYPYSILERIFATKLKNLFYVSAERRYHGNEEEFNFTQAEIYLNPSFNNFLQLIDDGKIMYDIRMGSYQSGEKIGKPHDHGSGFRIKPQDLPLLYAEHESVQ